MTTQKPKPGPPPGDVSRETSHAEQEREAARGDDVMAQNAVSRETSPLLTPLDELWPTPDPTVDPAEVALGKPADAQQQELGRHPSKRSIQELSARLDEIGAEASSIRQEIAARHGENPGPVGGDGDR
jgi:hypothetical protein